MYHKEAYHARLTTEWRFEMDEATQAHKEAMARIFLRSLTGKDAHVHAARVRAARDLGYTPMAPAPETQVTLTDEQFARLSERREAQLAENGAVARRGRRCLSHPVSGPVSSARGRRASRAT